MADPTNDHEAQARARKVASLYRRLRKAGATAQTVRYFTYTDWINTAKAAGTYTPSETTIAQVVELLESADAMDRAALQAERRAEDLLEQPADPFASFDLDDVAVAS
jgi:hypothetical protein